MAGRLVEQVELTFPAVPFDPERDLNRLEALAHGMQTVAETGTGDRDDAVARHALKTVVTLTGEIDDVADTLHAVGECMGEQRGAED